MIKRQIIYVLIFVAFFFINIGNVKSQQKWDETTTKQVYQFVLNDIQNLTLTDATKQKFATLCVSKLKKELPNGLSGVSTEKFNLLSLKVGKETFAELNDQKSNYWIISKEDAMYKDMLLKYESIFSNKSDQKAMINCILNKLFKKYPLGILDKSDKEKMDIFYTLGYDCAQAIDIPLIKWSTETEDAIRLKLYTYFENTELSQLQKITYTTCFIEKLKKKYPNGMSGNLEKEFAEAITECMGN